ncbi:hypothetical protein [Alkalihalophilus marmarensis]|uniref:hypothetical protein n=1 Tax=Alkalihalophilus marmarensis TaxID=521377 RepID=UPI002E1B7962|nr:hypothetical protein [Alkalihalophilus marmarensis]
MDNAPKQWDGKVCLDNQRKKWNVHKVIEYPVNGQCMRGVIATGFSTRKEAKEWVEQYENLEVVW